MRKVLLHQYPEEYPYLPNVECFYKEHIPIVQATAPEA